TSTGVTPLPLSFGSCSPSDTAYGRRVYWVSAGTDDGRRKECLGGPLPIQQTPSVLELPSSVLLQAEPVACLDQERVVRPRPEQVAVVAPEVERSGVAEVLAALLPDEEEHRARAVLPAQHGVGPELLEVEVVGRRIRVGREAVRVALGAGIDDFLELRVVAG